MDGQARGVVNRWVTLAGPIWLGRHDAQVRSPRRGSHLEACPEPPGCVCRRLAGFWSPQPELQGLGRARSFFLVFIRFTNLHQALTVTVCQARGLQTRGRSPKPTECSEGTGAGSGGGRGGVGQAPNTGLK